MADKNVYFFGNGKADGNSTMRQLLGGKGSNLAEMTNLGVPVPPGFTITTEVCKSYYDNNKQYPAGLQAEINENIKKMESAMGAKFSDKENPLLVSVRSGAAVSLPGMMDTVLNLGLNDVTVEGLAKKTGNERFAWDSYRRFIQMFSDVVMGVDSDQYEHAIDAMKKKRNVKLDTELSAADLKELVSEFKAIVQKSAGEMFPSDPIVQLQKSINAVFGSWNNDRAITYRKINDIRGLIGTAVNVQAMVFGNMGETSGTGVAFTRNPATGENLIYGEFLMNAQGEDVVAGVRTPETIDKLEKVMPAAYKQFMTLSDSLEKHFKEMQDMEFTIQEGKLYFLQTRTGKRTAAAALRIAVEMASEGLIDEKTAVLRIDANQLDQLLHPMFDPKAPRQVIAKGLNASPGAAVGKVVFSAEDAVHLKEMGEKTILVRVETSPEDIAGMDAAQGILTARGGATSHAAVVARGMGKCCVAGCSEINIDYKAKKFQAGSVTVKEHDFISLDGTSGEVMLGQVKTTTAELSGNFSLLMKWTDKYKRLKVRTNGDTPKDAETARKFGAEGIGLCRTEHMFFEGNRIEAVREMILADDKAGREKALAKLLPMQKGDFLAIFKAMEGYPVTIRLLDPPLHEFLPTKESDIEALSKDMGVSVDKLKKRVSALHEFNPMLGHRGCRLGITFPEIYDMQVKAIIQAAIEIKQSGKDIIPEIMIPLVGHVKELSILKENAIKIIDAEMAAAKVKLEYMIGTMIEVPRAAITADEIAKEAEFFSFGTNDLTQMTCGFSRDDSGSFLPEYVDKGIYERDPFQALDQTGVGEMMKIAIEKGRKVRPKIKLGICGEHGGEPSSVEFCHSIGLDYVSCSPFRVPIARLVAAQAVLKEQK
ncbi:MAG: pyruvate, phosphate dikinase [Candidatus Margulisiibacteriota bacterium]